MASNLRSLVSQVPDPNNPAVQGYRNQPKVIGDCEEVMGHYRSLTPKIATLGTTSSSLPFPPTQSPSLPPSLHPEQGHPYWCTIDPIARSRYRIAVSLRDFPPSSWISRMGLQTLHYLFTWRSTSHFCYLVCAALTNGHHAPAQCTTTGKSTHF